MENWTREKVRGATARKAGSKILTWLTVSLITHAAKYLYRHICLDGEIFLWCLYTVVNWSSSISSKYEAFFITIMSISELDPATWQRCFKVTVACDVFLTHELLLWKSNSQFELSWVCWNLGSFQSIRKLHQDFITIAADFRGSIFPKLRWTTKSWALKTKYSVNLETSRKYFTLRIIILIRWMKETYA